MIFLSSSRSVISAYFFLGGRPRTTSAFRQPSHITEMSETLAGANFRFAIPPAARPRRPLSPRRQRSSPGWIRSCGSGTTGHFTSRPVMPPRLGRSNGSPTALRLGTASSSAASSTSPAHPLLGRPDNAVLEMMDRMTCPDPEWGSGRAVEARKPPGGSGKPHEAPLGRHDAPAVASTSRQAGPCSFGRGRLVHATAGQHGGHSGPCRAWRGCGGWTRHRRVVGRPQIGRRLGRARYSRSPAGVGARLCPLRNWFVVTVLEFPHKDLH